MPKKTPKPAVEIRDADHCDTVLGTLAEISIALAEVEAKMNAEITAARERCESRIAALRGRATDTRKAIELFATHNRPLFAKCKTLGLTHGVLHFRITPPAVKTLHRRWTFGSVLEGLVHVGKSRWLRTKRELDKEAILGDYASGAVDDETLAGFGLRVTQDEQFDIDLRLDQVTA